MKAVLLTRTDSIEKHPLQLQGIANPMPLPGDHFASDSMRRVPLQPHMIEGVS